MKKIKFLIVIADPKEREDTKKTCEELGHTTICVKTPHEAKKYLSSIGTHDRIIVDIAPPNDKTISFCQQIRKNKPNTHLMILYSSDH